MKYEIALLREFFILCLSGVKADMDMGNRPERKECLIEAFHYAMEMESFSKERILEKRKNICIYGLGKYFEDAFIRQHIKERFHVTHLCDSDKEQREKIIKDSRYGDLQVVSPENLIDLDDLAIIFMLGDPRGAMNTVKAALKGKIAPEALMTYNDLVLDATMECKKDTAFYAEQENEILKAYELFQDDESRDVFVNVFCLRVAPHLAKKSYEELRISPQYFPKDIISLDGDECFVDCGAYNGDTLREFLRIVGQAFNAYYAFELDKDNFEKLQETATVLSLDRVICYPYGVWNESKEIRYGRMSSADSYSIFNKYETGKSKVVALDEILKDKRVTMIKMDIEGSEIRALQGCRRIISSQKPKLGICVYHRICDLWQIPLFIQEERKDYLLYMRHHADFWVSETVCYAV